jgi:hypothetical protein
MRDTIDMAREAGFETMRLHGVLPHVPRSIFIANACVTEEVNRLVALVRADEREACAKDFEAEADTWAAWPQAGAAKRKGADAIRARGNT